MANRTRCIPNTRPFLKPGIIYLDSDATVYILIHRLQTNIAYTPYNAYKAKLTLLNVDSRKKIMN